MRARLARGIWDWVIYKTLRKIIVTATALIIVAAAVVGAFHYVNGRDQCGGGYWRGPLHECVGVTDGYYDFIPALHPVDQEILQANQRVAVPYSTVALLLPLSATDPVTQTEIVHAVEGAYLAMTWANEQIGYRKIRLVLANPGSDSSQYPAVVQELKDMEAAPDNLLAVAGISVSTSNTQAEVKWLTHNGIPVVGGAIVADSLANKLGSDYSGSTYPGLARVEPTNQQEAQAVEKFADSSPGQSVLVEDTRAGDDYISTLAGEFASAAGIQKYTFTSPADVSDPDDTSAEFTANTVPSICGTSANTIYFAGRQVQLELFIKALAGSCASPARPFTIVTGSAAAHLVDPGSQLYTAAFQQNGITLDFPAIAWPGIWDQTSVATSTVIRNGKPVTVEAPLPAADDSFAKVAADLPDSALLDGQAIINYDAVLTAIKGIWQQSGDLTPQSIGANWRSLSGLQAVDGASGRICLDNAGNPYDKPVPIIQYEADGSPHFKTVIWPAGGPPSANCEVPPNG
jgi:hypothetical protein